MADRIDPGFGLVVLDDRITPERLAAKGTGARESAYTEGGPVPGHPAPALEGSQWRPFVQGAQSVDVRAITVRGGFPGVDGASVLYRLEDESGEESWYGWSDPNLATGWSSPADGWGAAQVWTTAAAAVIPGSQKIVVVVADASKNAQTFIYDPRTEAWTNGYDWDAGALDGLELPIGMGWDEDGEQLLLWSGGGISGARAQVGYRSTDGGVTWSLYTRGAFDDSITAGAGALRIATRKGLDWMALVLSAVDGTGVAQQYASSDRGVTWDRVDASGLSGTAHYPARTRQGFMVAHLTAVNGYPAVRLVGSARSEFNDAADIVLESTAYGNIWAAEDADGALYVYATGTSAALALDHVTAWRSADGGATWVKYTWEACRGDNATYPIWVACVAAMGQIHMVGAQSGAAATNGTFHLLSFGGFSTMEHGYGETEYARDGRERFGYGDHTGVAGVAGGILWVPWDFPDNMGWNRVVATGTRTLSPTGEQGMELTTTAGQGETYSDLLGTSEYTSVEAIVRSAASGNSTLATIGSINTGPHLLVAQSDGVTSYTAILDIASDGLQLRDGAFAIRATATIDTTQWMHVRVLVSSGGVASAWYRFLGDRKWVQIGTDVTITSGVATQSQMQFGCQTLSVGHLYFRMCGACAGGDWLNELNALSDIGETSIEGLRGLYFGKTIPGAGAAYPIPELTSDTEDVGRLTARGGPSFSSEVVLLPSGHTFPIDAVHPDRSASPRDPWETTDDSEVKLVWDLEVERWYGGGIALLALAATPRQFILEIDDGTASGWTTLGTLDKGWGSINYTLIGSTVVPRTGTATISRYLNEDELVGGYMVVQLTAGGTTARRIARQSAGFVTDDTTIQQVVIELEGVDGTEKLAGTGEIVHHSGLFVHYPTAQLMRRYLRVRVASGADVPEDTYGAGVLAIGRVVGVGADPAWDWSRRTELSRETSRRADGQLEVMRTGPVRRVLEHGWPDGVVLEDVRTLAADPARVASSTGLPIGSAEDVSTSLIGLIANQLRSGEVPAVVVPRLPSSDETITVPTLYLYGRLLSEAQGVSAFLGTEGVDEFVRVDGLAFEELS